MGYRQREAPAGVAIAVLLTAAGCAAPAPAPGAPADPVDELAVMMTGWFDSAEQAGREPEDYFHIRLVMLPIWPERTDGHWLYVEQAAASALERPYRQRVYHLHRTDDGRLVSDVYAIDDPLRHAGAWAREDGLRAIDPNDLTLRAGCSIVLDRAGPDRFAGATTGTGCASALRGASYATSEVEIEAARLTSWDRGWSDDGTQAWGATEGPYVFVKRGSGAPAPRP